MDVRASLLGPVEITVDGERVPLLDWSRRAPRSLLLMLLGSPGQRVPRDLVIETLWPDLDPDAAANALYKAIHFLRRAIEPAERKRDAASLIALTHDLVTLNQELDIWIDADAFERGIMTRSSSPEARRSALRQALRLYRGDFLLDEPYLDWPVARRELLQSLWERAVLELAALDREAGEPLLALPLLEALLDRDPLLEAAYQEGIRAYLAAGDRESARRMYQRCTAVLLAELGIEPDRETRALLEAPARLAAEPAARKRLPVAPAPIVGREHELDRIEELLADQDVRLVTLTGPGGVGKTRLVIEAAWQAAPAFVDGAIFVPLAPVRDAAQLGFAVANALGVRPGSDAPDGASIGAAIDEQDLLIVLDNVEQVIDAAATFVSELLSACRGPRLLVTSREHLRIRGEHSLAIPPLDVASADRSASTIANSDAVVLFTRLLRASNPDFAITPENAAAIARICARLDGLPLSLELAASRARRLSPEALLAALSRPLSALTAGSRDLPERHRTLRDAIAWSYTMLPEDEQRVFRALSVFAGGAPPAALDAILPGGALALDSLADKSLAVWTDTDAGPRVSLLETIREYAEESARDLGEWDALRAAHAQWMVALVEEAEPGYLGRDQQRWSDRLDIEMGNLRQALDWAFATGHGQTAARLIGSLVLFFEHRGHTREGVDWARQALHLEGAGERERIKLLRAASRLGFRVGEYAEADASYAEARQRSEAFGDPRLIADVLTDAASNPWYRSDTEGMRPLFERALAIYRELDDLGGQVEALVGVAMLSMLNGDPATAIAYDREAVEMARQTGNPMIYLRALRSQSITHAMNGELEISEPIFHEGLRLAIAVHDPTVEASFRHGLALVEAERGNLDAAIQGYLVVLDINRRTGHRQGYALALFELGRMEWRRQALDRAAGYLLDALTDFLASGVERWAIVVYDYAAGVLFDAGSTCLAAQLVGYADAARHARGIARMEIDAPYFNRLMGDLKTTFGEAGRSRHLHEGAQWTDRDARERATSALKALAGRE